MNKQDQPLIFELSKPGRIGYSLPELDVPEVNLDEVIPSDYLRVEEPEIPEVSELDIMRHYTALSKRNHGVDSGFYPLGSCTMKYNPKINETVARFPGFANIHPLQEESTVQGAMALMFDLQEHLKEITGMDEVTLQPAAGAHGEWTGLMMIRAYHESRGDMKRTKVIVPDSAHRSEEHTSELQSRENLVCRLLLEKKTQAVDSLIRVLQSLQQQAVPTR